MMVNMQNANTQKITPLVSKKIEFFQDVIQKTILNVQKNKVLDILGVSDINICLHKLSILNEKMRTMIESLNQNQNDGVVHHLQLINNELSALLKVYGTESLEDMLVVCFGNNCSITNNEKENEKYNLLKKYFHPTGYKVLNNACKNSQKDTTTTDPSSPLTKNLECSDNFLNSKKFHNKVYGIKLYIQNKSLNKNLVIFGIIDDVMIDFLDNQYIHEIKENIFKYIPSDKNFQKETFEKFVKSLTLKDYMTNSRHQDIYSKFIGYSTNYKMMKQRNLSQIVKDFITADLYSKRNTIIQLLIHSSNNSCENSYYAYLLYDLLSNDKSSAVVDTVEQTTLFDSFPWSIKQYFRDAMSMTVQYTADLSNFDMNKIPIEQQICLLKAPETVKEKAMIKLKEVKSKTEDSGSKARQYLDGLLKIPFGIYKKEPILYEMDDIKRNFKELQETNCFTNIPKKEKYTSVEIVNFVNTMREEICVPSVINTESTSLNSYTFQQFFQKLDELDKTGLVEVCQKINEVIVEDKLDFKKLKTSGKTKTALKMDIIKFSEHHKTKLSVLYELCNKEETITVATAIATAITTAKTKTNNDEGVLTKEINRVEDKLNNINNYIVSVNKTLDEAVHGHKKAKQQVERIIGQWINGQQDGYCFGFEGPPGVGKTSLAKRGLSHCLKDENGESRPFAMIQMGGDSNGSTLHGHNYTYVGSTWGSIVQILMDKKCMNPIIFIDEVDKISKTEHGREIVGILTHLLDPTQNDVFQDKYFNGIDLDLSNALFILSYNDPESIDKILLDRIHRIKFGVISLDEKLVIAKTYMLPEIYEKMGLENVIIMDDETLKFIIENYTCEAGVRKLKQCLFEIVGEINIDVLKKREDGESKESKYKDLPINISIDNIKNKYFKDKHEMIIKKVSKESKVGLANGMWANQVGQGGTLPVEAKFFPCDKFLGLKLTGMIGDVMNESANVALSVAWNLTPKTVQKELSKKYNNAVCKQGIHIHFPEGSVSKDGPSAGSCITSVIYSLLNNLKIRSNIALTGEITLNGQVTAIGGLDLKILGSMKAGVNTFLFPKENEKDYKQLLEKYEKTETLKGVTFHSVEIIEEVFQHIFDK
jgi:ATP-dependent Lon protease